ncbi:hypothetical protein ABZ918_05665 [Streptomyces viridosporus]|uniref:hypothetical protein n=1 Tax=Streptomyces viridosporus TaxID=67581 RepID=UPI00131A0261|nr:hypothetical protein [Streptomyces viridosporus]
MRSGIRAAIVGAAAVATLGLNAVPASAAGPTSCPRDGEITRWDRCTALSNGVLSVHTVKDGSHVRVNYYRTGGGSLTAKLGYERSGTSVFSANINMSTAPFHYERSWSTSTSCSAFYGKLLTSGGTLYITPPADPC